MTAAALSKVMDGLHSAALLIQFSPVRDDLEFAWVAAQHPVGATILRYQVRLLEVRKAMWAKPSAAFWGWFNALGQVGHRATTGIGKRVVFSLCGPVFEAHNFCFQRSQLVAGRLKVLPGIAQGDLRLAKAFQQDLLHLCNLYSGQFGIDAPNGIDRGPDATHRAHDCIHHTRVPSIGEA